MCASWSPPRKKYNHKNYMRGYRAVRRAMNRRDEDVVTDSDPEDEIPMLVEEADHSPDNQDDSESEVEIPLVENRDQGIGASSEHAEDFNAGDWEDIDSDIPITSSEESSDEEDFEFDQPLSFGDELVMWINNHQIKHNAVDKLLKLLQRHGHDELPSTARTLLHTTKDVQVTQVSGMDYIYLGLDEQLIKAYKCCKSKDGNDLQSIDLGFNIDGIPLFKSSNSCVWPILCSITNVHPAYVFSVVLTHGHSKPNNLDFLLDTIRDVDVLLQSGLNVDGEIIPVRVKFIVCDAPAKSLIKGTKLYSGYYGCDKCCQSGEWKGRVTYQDVKNLEERSDQSFRSQTQEEHHNGDTPFVNLPLDMIKAFPIDFMHQSCLGVMRKLILIWMRGKGRLLGARMSSAHIQAVNERLAHYKSSITKEFQRKPRAFSEIDRWKATEFRQFLLYTGKIALEGILRRDLYEHFMALSVATCILVSPALAVEYNVYATQLMEYFNEQGRVLYGAEFLVYNVHSMVHLPEAAREFGDINICAAFAFENYLQSLKKLVRSGKRPIVQIAKRLSERRVKDMLMSETDSVSIKKPNNCYVLSDSSCCEVQENSSEKDDNGDALFLCRVYSRSDDAFRAPCQSKLIGVHKVQDRNTSMRLIPKGDLLRKAMKFDIGRGTAIFMSLLHQN